MRVLLTGGGGAIGCHVMAHILANTDWEVVIIDSFRHKGFKDRITSFCSDKIGWKERIIVLQHDLVCPISPSLQRTIGRIDYILHLAAVSDVGFSVDNPTYTIMNNVQSTLTMLDYAMRTKPKTFIYFSTDEVYGPVAKDQAHKEGDPHRPSNAYSASKAASEDICYAYWRSYGIPLIITNTMNNFGETQSPSKFPAMIQQRLERGERVTIHGNTKEIGSRYYIHSRNTADALLFILKRKPHLHVQGRVDEPDRYHIVGDEKLTNLGLAQLIATLMGKKLYYELVDFHTQNPAHDIHYGMQDNRLRPAGWKPPLSLEESLAKTIAWQQGHKEWLIE